MYNYFAPYSQQIITVNGEAGANAYQMASNSSAILLDETRPLIYLARTDGAGYKTITPYSITEYKPEDPMAKFEARLARLESMYESHTTSAEHETESN